MVIIRKILEKTKELDEKIKDMKPYLTKGVFKKLKNKAFFKNEKIEFGTIAWPDGIDMCADSLYETSKNIEK